jgi:diguanylate cyclase (GGDEF)-like protein
VIFLFLEEDALNNEISNEKLIEHLLRNQKKDTKIKLYDQSLQEEKTFVLKISSLHKDKKGEYILSLTDITETERLKKSYQLQAILDPLTKIYNRQAFNDKYPKEFYYAKTKDKELRLLMADIDHFKKINDTYGHQIGDYVLKEFCKIINLLIPNNYFFARWGGEEFIIIAQDDTLENVMHYAQKIRKAVEDFEFLHVGKVTVSLGVASLRKEDEENSFLARVDEALYKAKQEGRNRVVNL